MKIHDTCPIAIHLQLLSSQQQFRIRVSFKLKMIACEANKLIKDMR